VARQINPQINCTLILEDLGADDRISFTVKDQAWLQESHIGGFGPQHVAFSSLPLQDFDGWVELRPAVEVPSNGWPVMQLEVKVRPATAWPSEGFASDRMAFFQIDPSQATASAPAELAVEPEPEQRGDGVSASTPKGPELLQRGQERQQELQQQQRGPEPQQEPQQQQQQQQQQQRRPEPQPQQRGDGVSEDGWPDFRWQTFYIDPRAWTFAKKGELLGLLKMMSMRSLAVSFQ